MVDGFRYGFFGQSDIDPWHALAVVSLSWLVLGVVAMRLLKSGYHLRG